MAKSPALGQTVQGFRLRVLLPVVTVTLVAVLSAGFGLYSAARNSDAIAIDRQIRETRHAISRSLDELALHQEAVAVWDDLVLELQKAEPDWQWVDDNIGVWLYSLFGHDEVYVLMADGTVLYSMANGARAAPARYSGVRNDLKPLLETVGGSSAEDNNPHSRLPGRPLHPESTVRTSEKAVHRTELIKINGRPAAASVMRIVPLTEKASLASEVEHLLVSIRFLDGQFLEELARRNLIDDPRFSRYPDTKPGEQLLTLDFEHERNTYFIWRPELPGTALLHALAPITALCIGVMILIMAWLSGWLHRTMLEKEDSILKLQASEAEAQRLALHDALTGLPNRAKFNECADELFARAKRGAPPFALLLLDLDRFKHVNDTLGHLAGDALIRELAARLLRLVGEEDVVARLGGDEFAVLRSNVPSLEALEALCEGILDAVRDPFELLGHSARVGVSIGVALAPEAGTDRADLMRKADIALYRAKAEGRDCYRLFTPVMDESVRTRRRIEEELRTALDTGEGLMVYYQPQVAYPGGSIVGLEALLRWRHPALGFVQPEKFIAVAEETGLIGQLGEWVLGEACAASRRWPHLFIAVNLSPVQVRARGFADRLMAIVRSCGADPRRIELEVTENVLLEDSDQVREGLQLLRAAGFRIALDDFGTGYSSLSYLRRFEVDKIKIDRSFVRQLGDAVDSTAIVSAVLALGHAMGLTVTAEGVETQEQRRFLEGAGCKLMQGFLFSRPVPEEELDQLIGVARRQQALGAA